MSITIMDSNGRVALSVGIRFRLNLNEGDKFAIDRLGDGTIILKKVDRIMEFEKWLNEDEASGSQDI
jgi:AbrB family looped-hinge helix DNA binding protein